MLFRWSSRRTSLSLLYGVPPSRACVFLACKTVSLFHVLRFWGDANTQASEGKTKKSFVWSALFLFLSPTCVFVFSHIENNLGESEDYATPQARLIEKSDWEVQRKFCIWIGSCKCKRTTSSCLLFGGKIHLFSNIISQTYKKERKLKKKSHAWVFNKTPSNTYCFRMKKGTNF